jgi:hypothetical protein
MRTTLDHLSRASSIVVSILVLSGCASSGQFPLCPRIAEESYPSGSPGAVVNLYARDQAAARHLIISPLSSFAAVVSGSYEDLRWFNQNYPTMLCAFDPHQEVLDRERYISCTIHAPHWIEIIRSSHPEDLMLIETKFRENCSALRPYGVRRFAQHTRLD